MLGASDRLELNCTPYLHLVDTGLYLEKIHQMMCLNNNMILKLRLWNSLDVFLHNLTRNKANSHSWWILAGDFYDMLK